MLVGTAFFSQASVSFQSMKRIVLICLFLTTLRVQAQDYKQFALDGGMELTQNFSRHAYSSDSALVTLSSVGANLLAVTKTGLDGTIQWQYQLRAGQVYGHYDVVVLDNDDVLLMHTIEAPTGAIRYWIQLVKLDKSGNIIWTKSSESYQDFRPQVMEYLDGSIHIAGQVSVFDSQVFYMKLDTAAQLLKYDSRKADYQEVITSITKFKDWTILGGTQYFGGGAGPLFVAVDPGGNLRYFYHLPRPESSSVIGMIANDDSLIAITENSIITFDRPIARTTRVYSVNPSSGLAFSDIQFNPNGGYTVSGSMQKLGRFTQNPSLISFEPGFKSAKVRQLTDHNYSHWFSYHRYVSDNSIVLGGNKQLGHYYGTTITYADKGLRSVCEGHDTTFQLSHDTVGIFTYVPSSELLEPKFVPTVRLITPTEIQSSISCIPTAPLANFELSNDTICINECALVTNLSEGAAQTVWTATGSTAGSSTSVDPRSFCYQRPGNYEVKIVVKNSVGSDSMVKNIVVQEDECADYFYIPNVFTPDKNSRNERFGVRSNITTPIQMKIYSRYGELIYDVTEVNPMWDGIYQGVLCQEGVYLYFLEYVDLAGKSRQRFGTLHLLITD
jgi:gliding motility-associated-like protein